MDKLIEALQLGVKMRACQRTYFTTRKQSDLQASIQAEREFDKAAAEALRAVGK